VNTPPIEGHGHPNVSFFKRKDAKDYFSGSLYAVSFMNNFALIQIK
jgi:hypothetical protein